VLVILDHLNLIQRLPTAPEGGFVGVDVFFVISGFLITGHLVKEVSATGSVSFRMFYARRARRILPMAVLVTVITVIASLVVFWPGRAMASLWDALWSLLFVSNIAFAARGTDYFAQEQASIFQHYWSLSVEEQFYLVWPVLILAVALLALRRGWPVRLLLNVMVVVVALASIAVAIASTHAAPTAAYFSTFARGFEFLLGAMVAVNGQALGRMRPLARTVLSIAGLGGIAASVVLIDPLDGFPGPQALLPAASAALFILAGTGIPQGVSLWPLTTRGVSYIGNISYSLYLWHWPVITITAALVPLNSVLGLASAMVVTLILSAASYRWVERPISRSRLLLPAESRTQPASSRVPVWRPASGMVSALLVAVLLVAGTSLAGQENAAARGGVVLSSDTRSVAVTALQTEIAQSTERDSWGVLGQDVETALDQGDKALSDDCWNDRDSIRNHCLIGPADASSTVAVFGDSMAMNWIPALRQLLTAHPGWNLSVYAKVGCPYADVPVFDTDGSLYENCETFRDRSMVAIAKERPEKIVLASALKKSLPNSPNKGGLSELWASGVAATLAGLPEDSSVLVLAPPPEGRDLASCANRFTKPSQCSSSTTPLWADTILTTRREAQRSGAQVADVGLWFCLPSGVCPAVVGDMPVRQDTVHMTEAYSRHLAPAVEEVLFAKS
jgi:peptidoglycan/LPS O-acetylase OafA/YrhL